MTQTILEPRLQSASGNVFMRILLCLCLCVAGVVRADELEKNFTTPPASARPWMYWLALNGNLTKEGITADLEAMARVGIGGVIEMEADQGTPKGKVDFASPEWMEIFSHECREAKRLGLEVNMNNDAGWCGSGGPWIPPELSMQKLVWREMVVEGGKEWTVSLPQPEAVRGYYRDVAVLAMPHPEGKDRIPNAGNKALFAPGHLPPLPATFRTAPEASVIPRSKIVNLTGKQKWVVPPGKWLVIRFGCTTTGKDNHPAPDAGRGLECDKFNKEAIAFHYKNLIGKMVEKNRALSGKGKVFVSTHIDSWEVGSQNWTPKMPEEFKARRGYDLIPFLPAFAGYILDSEEVSERFLWDLRQTVSELIINNYAAELRRIANKDGLRLSIEAYSWDNNVPVDETTYAGQADEPMAEFWAWPCGGYPRVYTANSCPGTTSAAHTYGKRIINAEAFTSSDAEKWQSHPATIKILGDWAFCEGINRFVFHRYAVQPWTNVAPGMAMGPWGLHYERTQTWWEQSKAWHEYVARCQYLLQQGLYVADACYLQPEGAPRRVNEPSSAMIATDIRGGYNFDGCSPDVVMTRMSVKNGRIVLPDGMSYRVLVLPETETMTLGLLRKIKELSDKGAVIIGGHKPPQKSPSLSEVGAGDAEVKKLAGELWPKLVTGKTAGQLLKERGVPPDFSATPKLRYTHRTMDGAEIYFVANPESRAIEATASFRMTGKRPELWWPDTGRTEKAAMFQQKDGVTTLPVQLEPGGSVFVVFREPVKQLDPIVSITRDGQPVTAAAMDIHRGEIQQSGKYVFATAAGKSWSVDVALPAAQEITGAWAVAFDPKWGGPASVTFDKLEDWSKRSEEGIRYYSGTATYRKKFDGKRPVSKQRVYLDLGKVAVMATVTLNGKDLGILWKPPYRVDVTDALKDGENTLDIKVVNLWINRMVGDENLPEDSDRNPDGTLKKWPQWLEEGKPSPTGRYTFTTWRLWHKNDPLATSGLLGPVTLETVETIKK